MQVGAIIPSEIRETLKATTKDLHEYDLTKQQMTKALNEYINGLRYDFNS